VWAEGRDPAAATVDQPELTQGGWVRDGGVVVEAGFADALELDVGDEITLQPRVCGLMIRGEAPDCRVANRRSFEVAGVAVTAAARPYPDVCFGLSCPELIEAGNKLGGPPGEAAIDAEAPEDPVEPGLVWLTQADARGLAPRRQVSPTS
jgi:hypothetical protein